MGVSKKEQQENEKYRRYHAEIKRRQEKQADAWAYLQMRTHEPDPEGRYLVKVACRVRWDTVGDVLVILTCEGELGGQVAFGQADELMDAVTNAANRWSNGQLRWKEDQYGAAPNGSNK